MYFKQITTPGLGCYSYLIGCPLAGSTAVVDPKRDIDIYLQLAAENGMKITHIFDTHVHADHISGARELSRATGAPIHIHQSAPIGYEAEKVGHGDMFKLGAAELEILHTPGHTPNSISILVTDAVRSPMPQMILTGDLLFVGDTGRPDLPGEEIMAEQVRNLYDSLNKTLGALPDGLEIYPAHGQGSLCGGGQSAMPHSTLGYERVANRRLGLKDFDEFSKDVLSNLPMRPQSFSHIIAANLKGPSLLTADSQVKEGLSYHKALELKKGGALFLDLRNSLAFASAHIPGSLHVDGHKDQALNWIGVVVPPESSLVLILDQDADSEERLTQLRRIGYDKVEGWLKGGLPAWIAAGGEVEALPYISAGKLKAALSGPNPPEVIDVRTEREYASSKIPGARHVPFEKLLADPSCLGEPKGERVIVCQSGFRAAIAGALLQSRGCRVSVIAGGMEAFSA